MNYNDNNKIYQYYEPSADKENQISNYNCVDCLNTMNRYCKNDTMKVCCNLYDNFSDGCNPDTDKSMICSYASKF